MLIAGNWKMNTDAREAVSLVGAVVEAVRSFEGVRVAVCPPFTNLSPVHDVLHRARSHVQLGAQNLHYEEAGAFTGEVSASMLKSVGCTYVIIGHSERRQYFGETDRSVNLKATKALEHGLIPIVCVGETLDEREAGRERDVVQKQIIDGLAGIDLDDADRLVIAYEPVWAIGTGRTASPDQARAMHGFIRQLLTERYGETGRAVHILYGGSMKPANAADLLAQPDVDGGLIGGASLKAADFAAIVAAATAIAG